MEKRKTLNELCAQYKNAIKIALLIIVPIVIFIVGYLVSWNFIKKPLNDNQFKLCEQVAQDVYNQKTDVIAESPKGFSVDITATTITVELEDKLSRGKVIAKKQGGELVMMRDMETVETVCFSILVGILFIFLSLIILAIIDTIVCAFRKKLRC